MVVTRRWPQVADHPWVVWTYDLVMVGLSLTVLWTLPLPDGGWVRRLNAFVWLVFALDLILRLVLSDDRWHFLRARLPETLAIALPLDFLGVARVARVMRGLRVLRGGAVVWRASRGLRDVLTANRLAHVMIVTIGVVLGGATAIEAAEPRIGGFGDAVWWAIVTTTTVGYGDVAPTSTAGRLVAVTLMLVGIGTMGVIAGSVATVFLTPARQGDDGPIEAIRRRLEAWDELSAGERRMVAAALTALADQGQAGDPPETSTSRGDAQVVRGVR